MLLEAHKWHMKQYIEVVKDVTPQQLRVRLKSTHIQVADLVCCLAPHLPMHGSWSFLLAAQACQHTAL